MAGDPIVVTNYNIPSNLKHKNLLISKEDLQYPSLNWVKSPIGNFFHVKNGVNFNSRLNAPLDPTVPPELVVLPVSLNGASVDEFVNNSRIGTLQLAILSKNAKDFIKFKIEQTPHHGDKFYLTAISELKSFNYNLTPFTYMADSTLPAGKFKDQRYSLQGDIKNILNALASCITYSDNPFIANVSGDSIVIEDYAQGYKRNSVSFGISKGNVTSNFIKIFFDETCFSL